MSVIIEYMFKFINCLVNYGVVLLFGVSLMAGSTTGVPMSPGMAKPNRNAAPPTQQQHTQQSVTTPPRLQSTTPTYMPRVNTQKP
jgi:hypothetical protein